MALDSPDCITKSISNLRSSIPRVDHDSPREVTAFFSRILDILSELNTKVQKLEKRKPEKETDRFGSVHEYGAGHEYHS